jgi:DNA gyrase subunit A
VFTVTDGGFAKKTVVEQYRLQGRGGIGVKAAKLNDERGGLVAGLVVTDSDEVLAIRASGQVTRSSVAEVQPYGRDTMGQIFARANGDPIVAIARNAEKDVAEVVEDGPVDEDAAGASHTPADAVATDLGADEPVTDEPVTHATDEIVTDGTDETQEL